MSRMFSTSPLVLGIIEDVEINLLKYFKFYYRNGASDQKDLLYSIKEKGLLQPIIVRNSPDNTKDTNRYEIVAGHRRYEACKKLGWRRIICHIVELDDQEALEISLIENMQRRNLDLIEEAHAYRSYVVNFGWGGISDLALKLGKSTSHIDKRIRLLELPPEVIDSVSKSGINVSTAEELLCIKDKNKQSMLASLINKKRFSLRQTRKMVRELENDTIYDYDKSPVSQHTRPRLKDIDETAQRSFDKSIIALRVAIK
jgi:ParB family transcriptional regulator, chromosome partitioning protein